MKSAFELLAAGGALEAVAKERERQDAKWGIQDHAHEVWLAILGEEYGELARAILETRFDNGLEAKARGGIANIRKEAVQVAAVAVAMVECLDRVSKENRKWVHCNYCNKNHHVLPSETECAPGAWAYLGSLLPWRAFQKEV